MNSKTRILVALLGLSAVIIASIFAYGLSNPQRPTATAVALASEEPNAVDATIANCRYGATPLGESSVSAVSDLGAGWYLNFGSAPWPTPPGNGAEFARMISLQQKKNGDQYLPGYIAKPELNAAFANFIKQNPGEIYIAGNEVDRTTQGEMFPEEYARAYHDVYTFIKGVDPTAQVAISGLVQVTPNRLQYLDLVWKAYLKNYGNVIPVDIWTMHLYILPEVLTDGVTPNNGGASVALGTDPRLGKRESGGDPNACSNPDVYCYAEHDDMSVFAQQVVAMRQWMKDHGQRNKPLLLTEFSLLYPYELDAEGCFLQDEKGNCFTPPRVKAFMTNSFSYLNTAKDASLGYPQDDNRLIQRWMWFSIFYNQEGAVSNLAQQDRTTLTLVGQNFKDKVAAEGRYRNLIAETPAPIIAYLKGQAQTTAVLQATFRNNGNETIKDPFQVTFYRDAGLTQVIGSVQVNPEVTGCATLPYTVSVPWPNLGQGTHKYWVLVDSGSTIPEVPTGNGDNVAEGVVTVYKNQLNLPVVRSDE